jgi:DNA-binding transcriptional LysR family regulator
MLPITIVNLANVDLNLLVVLHAVLEEASATRAAKRLHVTQSAVSNSLARLRELLGDPLVVRNGRGLVATPRARELAPLLTALVDQAEAVLGGSRSFQPEQSTRTFVFAAADNHQAGEVPAVAAAFARHLPKAKLRVVSADYLIASDGLASGAVDVALAPEQAVQPVHRSIRLFEDPAAFVVRRDHPKVKDRLTRKLFNTLPHIDIEIALGNKGVGNKAAQRYFKQVGLTRNVALSVPHFVIAAMVAARTDCVAPVPARVARRFCEILPLKIVRPPFPFPSLTTVLMWHRRSDADPGAKFFRDVIVEAIGEA